MLKFCPALMVMIKLSRKKWVPASSTGKIYNDWIRDLSLIPTYTKNRLESEFDDNELLSGANVIGWNS